MLGQAAREFRRYAAGSVFRILILALWLAGGLLHAIPQAEAGSGKTVRVGYFESGGMMIGAQDGARKDGYSYEYLQALSFYTGWKYEYVNANFEVIYDMLLRGEVDIVPLLSRTEERIGKVLFPSRPIGREQFFLATDRAGKGRFVGDINANFEGKKIGVNAGYAENALLEEYLRKHDIHAEIVSFASEPQKSAALHAHKVDATLNSNNAFEDDMVLLQDIGSMPCYIGVSLARPDLLAELNDAESKLALQRPNYEYYLMQKHFKLSPINKNLSYEELAWLQQHPVLRIGTCQNNFPYVYQGSGGEMLGIFPELLEKALQRMDVSLAIEWKSYDNYQVMHQDVKEGKIDLAFPEPNDLYEADLNDFLISQTVFQAVMGVFHRDTMSNETFSRIAVASNGLGMSYVLKHYPSAEIISCETLSECVERVMNGEATAAIGRVSYLQALTKDYTASNRATVYSLAEVCDACVSAKRDNMPLILFVNRVLKFVSPTEIADITFRHSVLNNTDISARNFFLRNPAYLLVFFLLLCGTIFTTYAMIRFARSERELEAANRSIQKANDQLEGLVQSRTEELQEALYKAEMASKSKTTFLFNMSHDIRTPMNAILGFNKMARKYFHDAGRLKDCLDKVETAGEHLLSLINEILEMARIENGKLVIEKQPVNLRQCKGKVTPMLDSLAKEKNISFLKEYKNMDEDCWLSLDTMRIDQVLLNILSNAIKYTPDGGTVKYSLEKIDLENPEQVALCFTVADNGIGMNEEFVEQIFENFSRERNSTTSGIQGCGLGMAIVKRIVDAMNGTIQIESEPEKGTTVRFEVVADRVADPSAPADPSDISLSGLRVLLVEDNMLNREISGEILEDFGISVDYAEDGRIAVEKMEKASAGDYDIVLMDIQMPYMDGYQATAKIRKLPDPKVAGIPIYAMTANAFSEDKERSREAGMNGHLAKPIEVEELEQVLREAAYRKLERL